MRTEMNQKLKGDGRKLELWREETEKWTTEKMSADKNKGNKEDGEETERGKGEMEGWNGSEKEEGPTKQPRKDMHEKRRLPNDKCRTLPLRWTTKTTRKWTEHPYMKRKDALQQTAPDLMLELDLPRRATETKMNQWLQAEACATVPLSPGKVDTEWKIWKVWWNLSHRQSIYQKVESRQSCFPGPLSHWPLRRDVANWRRESSGGVSDSLPGPLFWPLIRVAAVRRREQSEWVCNAIIHLLVSHEDKNSQHWRKRCDFLHLNGKFCR